MRQSISSPLIHRVLYVSLVSILVNSLNHSTVLSTTFSALGNLVWMSIIGARLLINMKEAGEKGLGYGTSCVSKPTITTVEFAAPSSSVESSSEESVGETNAAL